MHFDTRQQKLFQSALKPLLFYANERLHTIEGLTRDASGRDNELQFELVARALWQHLDLIDDYLRDHAKHIEERHRSIVSDLRGTLYDDFVLTGTCDDGGIFLHDTGIYVADTFTTGILDEYHDEAVIVRTALIPFMGHIAVAAPFCAIGIATQERQDEMRTTAGQNGSDKITDNAAVLTKRARVWQKLKKRRRAEEDAPTQPAGPGYHRGALAGLPSEERERLCTARYDLAAHESGVHKQLMELHALECDELPTSLAEGLDLLDSDWLESIAGETLEQEIAHGMKRESLIDLICQQVNRNEAQRDLALMWCDGPQFELVRKLVHTNPLSLDTIRPSEAVRLFPMIPYVFILQEQDRHLAWMPPEVSTSMQQIDFDIYAAVRTRLERAAYAAGALATMCGIISLDDAYERYKAVEDDPLEREQFESALAELEVCDRRDSYALWNHGETTYLISAELSEESALARVVRESYAENCISLPQVPGGPPTPTFVAIDECDESEMRRRLDLQSAQMLAMRMRLLDAHRSEAAHPLEATMLEQHFVDYLMNTEPLRRIRDYVDEHMPDNEDEFAFAETFARAVIVSVLFEHESYDDALDLVRLFGMTRCEGERYPHTLAKLITDAYNALPVWKLNGWSLTENTERITGKKVIPQADRTRS